MALRPGRNGPSRFSKKKNLQKFSFGLPKGSLPEKNLPWGAKGKNLENFCFWKILIGHFDQCAMPIEKMVSLFILLLGNPEICQDPFTQGRSDQALWRPIHYQKDWILKQEKKVGKYERNFNLWYWRIYSATHFTNNIYSLVGVMAFSLGLTLAQAKLTKKQFVMSVLVFSLASPLGMAIGIFLSDLDRTLGVDFANAILQTIAGGTFLYITFFEVLPHEFNQPKNRMLKVLFVLLGFSVIAGLIFITHWNDNELGKISWTKNKKRIIFCTLN